MVQELARGGMPPALRRRPPRPLRAYRSQRRRRPEHRGPRLARAVAPTALVAGRGRERERERERQKVREKEIRDEMEAKVAAERDRVDKFLVEITELKLIAKMEKGEKEEKKV